ncbi:MAG TPA: TonB-dependent receptor [Sphingomicrobium sp.]|jgi:outer membrane receptor protein involved in Fe transport
MRATSHITSRAAFVATLLASSMLAAPTAALAQDASASQPTSPTPADPANRSSAVPVDQQEIVVTATKRAENLQNVPAAITAITTKTLEDLHVNQFEDYARLVPSLSVKGGGGGGGNAGPSTNTVYFRGVASGENANHSTSLPSVGTYLDEQPITTISGALNVHVFDMARIEALAGPQGTLYGASSQAGTIRLITNKPDLSGTYGQANLEVNHVAHGGFGYLGEGFINTPLTSNMALRVVGWHRRDSGWIDNVLGEMVFPTAGITINNADLAEDDYNHSSTTGARAALKIDLDDQWTVTPSIMGQRQKSNGNFAEENIQGKYQTMQFNPESTRDKWVQAALTIEGKVGIFDMTYAGAYMKRRVDIEADYSDYSYFYDALYGSTLFDNAGNTIDPNQAVVSNHRYSKLSQELRFVSPADQRLRLVAGLFYQRQVDKIEENYVIDNIADEITVPGTESNIWLTRQNRIDRDYAAFGELSYDVMPTLTVTGGARYYKYNNTLFGFFGASENWLSTGIATCFGPAELSGTPCTNVDKGTKDSGFVHRLNVTWKPNDRLLTYATWSRGFRPGGINRRGSLPPYKPDFLTNYEIGAKYKLGGGAHFNVAGYREDWDDVQLSFLGQNGLTEVRNAGSARIWGVEADLLLRPAPGLTWSTGVSYNDAKITRDFCLIANADFNCALDVDLDGDGVPEENALLAPSGTRLPLTAKFKGSSQLRYEWQVAPQMKANVQGLITYEGKRTRDLRLFENSVFGNMPSYTQVDLSAGIDRGAWTADVYVKNLFDTRGQVSKAIQCLETTCGDPDNLTPLGGRIYTSYTRPRMIGLKVGRRF